MEKLTIVLSGFGNAAFEENLQEETARILRSLANNIERGGYPVNLLDINGNKVGKVIIEE